jgi:hypothetical protein
MSNNPQSDCERLYDWVERLKVWVDQGIRDIYFFVHQDIELESPFLSAYFIDRLNKEFGLTLQIPKLLGPKGDSSTTLGVRIVTLTRIYS